MDFKRSRALFGCLILLMPVWPAYSQTAVESAAQQMSQPAQPSATPAQQTAKPAQPAQPMTPAAPAQSTQPNDLPAQPNNPAAAQQPAPSAVSDNQYIIGPGDTLQVVVWRNPEISTTVPVRPDGKISTPLVDNMVAVGKTPSQLARDVETRLAEYVRSPQVTVIVTQAASVYSQVKVVGQVMRPQAVPYREGMTVLDVMIQVGGLGQFAAGNRAKIERLVDGKQVEIPVKLSRLLEKGDLKQNLRMLPGDVIVVPQTLF